MTTPTNLDAWESLRDVDPALAQSVLKDLSRKVFVPHQGGQREVAQSQARFRALRAGRRWGKTKLASHEVVKAALAKPNQMVWWVANTQKNVRRGYRNVREQVPRRLLTADPPSDMANDLYLSFTNGSRIEFYTAGTPDALAGEGVDFVVIDEAALIPENVWMHLIRPTLSDTRGRALLISTPRGRNWFHKMWHRGQDPNFPHWESWHFRTEDSPYIDMDEIEDARATLPAILFAQEYEAEFVANAASIFTLETEDRSAVVPGLVPPQGWVTLGVDLAKKEDFTVITGCNSFHDRQPCVYDRFNEVSWPVQQQYILDIAGQLQDDPAVEGVTVGIDSTGVGDVVHDNLEAAGLIVVPVNFASGNIKERMVRLLAADLENGRASIPEVMRDEFEHYEYSITPNGRYTFSAPEGAHDDKVSAKLIENWVCTHEAPPSAAAYVPTAEKDIVDESEMEEVQPDSPADIMARPGAWG